MNDCYKIWGYQINAWILDKRLSGETSLQLSMFTREQGLLRITYRGGRTSKKQALLQAFTLLWVELDLRTGNYIQQLECHAPSLMFKGKSLFAALYVNELTSYIHCIQEPNAELYDVYVDTLHKLEMAYDKPAIERSLRYFELKWLNAQGYALPLTNPIHPTAYYVFILDQGFIPAKFGYLGTHVAALQAGHWDTSEVLRILKIITRTSIQHALGGRAIKTRELFSTNT